MIRRIGVRMVLLVASLFINHLLSTTTAEQCGTEYSVFGMMLMRHNFKTMKTSGAMECLHACRDDVRCQSLNYVMGEDSCELNDRTNKARPEHFVPDSFRYYFTRDKNRGELLLFVLSYSRNYSRLNYKKRKNRWRIPWYYMHPYASKALEKTGSLCISWRGTAVHHKSFLYNFTYNTKCRLFPLPVIFLWTLSLGGPNWGDGFLRLKVKILAISFSAMF